MAPKINSASTVVLLLLIQFFTSIAFAKEKSDTLITWQTNFEEAQKQAETDGKLILLYFSGSDWCRPCMQLKLEIFETEAFKTFANENFILIQFDFPAKKANQLSKEQRMYNEKMAEKYNPQGAFPDVIIVDQTGNKIGEVSGYYREGVEAYINKLKKLINK